jgi:hypothetical protein
MPAQLRRVSLEPFLGARAGDDLLPVAPAELRPQLALLLPQLLEAFLEPMYLGLELRVVHLGQLVPQLNAALAQLVDLSVDALQSPHVTVFNAIRSALFPGPVRKHLTAQRPRKYQTITPAPSSAAATATAFRNVTIQS